MPAASGHTFLMPAVRSCDALKLCVFKEISLKAKKSMSLKAAVAVSAHALYELARLCLLHAQDNSFMLQAQ